MDLSACVSSLLLTLIGELIVDEFLSWKLNLDKVGMIFPFYGSDIIFYFCMSFLVRAEHSNIYSLLQWQIRKGIMDYFTLTTSMTLGILNESHRHA